MDKSAKPLFFLRAGRGRERETQRERVAEIKRKNQFKKKKNNIASNKREQNRIETPHEA